MIGQAKAWAKRHWPCLPLRAYLFASFFLVAALPGVGAVFLRVYENALVRQTGAELVAQGQALAAAAAPLWPGGGVQDVPAPMAANAYGLATPVAEIDLSRTPILSERPQPASSPPPESDAVTAAERLRPVLEGTRPVTLASIILLDAHGRIVDGSAMRGSYARLPEVASALAGHTTTSLRRNGAYRATYRFDWLARAAALRVHRAQPIMVHGRVLGVLLLSRSAHGLFVGLYEDWGKIAFGVLAIFLALIVLSGLLSRGIARPIETLRTATRGLALGRGQMPPVPETAAAEIQDLYRDFSSMAAAIDHRSRYLRDFAHAVSHEFKTPLAGIRGAVELLQDHGATMSPDDRRRFLANADAGAARLTLLVSRLLDLVRADMMTDEAGSCDAVAVIAKVADAVRSPGLQVSIEATGAAAWVRAAPATLETVLMTLAENARQAGAATLTLSVMSDADVRFTVTDDGPGIAAADRDRIFEPFFT